MSFSAVQTLNLPKQKSLFCVYHVFDTSNRIMYVGCTSNIKTRFQMHKAKSPWFSEMARLRCRWFAAKSQALSFEERQIGRLRPPFNKTCRTKSHSKGKVVYCAMRELFEAKREPSVKAEAAK